MQRRLHTLWFVVAQGSEWPVCSSFLCNVVFMQFSSQYAERIWQISLRYFEWTDKVATRVKFHSQTKTAGKRDQTHVIQGLSIHVSGSFEHDLWVLRCAFIIFWFFFRWWVLQRLQASVWFQFLHALCQRCRCWFVAHCVQALSTDGCLMYMCKIYGFSDLHNRWLISSCHAKVCCFSKNPTNTARADIWKMCVDVIKSCWDCCLFPVLRTPGCLWNRTDWKPKRWPPTRTVVEILANSMHWKFQLKHV